MKFRNPETGKVMQNSYQLYRALCIDKACPCPQCPIRDKVLRNVRSECEYWIYLHQEEAARLMGYEVIEEEDMKVIGTPLERQANAAMDKKPDRPLSEWTLTEVSRYCVARKCDDCKFGVSDAGECRCGLAKNSPAAWDCSEWGKPRLTPAELAICKAVGAKWVSRDKDEYFVILRSAEPVENGNGCFCTAEDSESWIADVGVGLFPSVKPGDCICVYDD